MPALYTKTCLYLWGAEKLFNGYLIPFNGLSHYEHTVFYNKKYGALAWFHPGISTCDMLVGCNDKNFVNELIQKLNFNKAKFLTE